jgi:hypothetical protein
MVAEGVRKVQAFFGDLPMDKHARPIGGSESTDHCPHR